jgi:hypothetical protein
VPGLTQDAAIEDARLAEIQAALASHKDSKTPAIISRSFSEMEARLAEICLGHVVSGVEGAYRRSDMLERRRAIMQAWSDFIVESH